MKVRSQLVLAALIVALAASTSLALPATAMPGAETGVVFGTKAAKEAEKAAREAAAEAEKQVRRCRALGTLPCAPTVTLTWLPYPFSERACMAQVSVAGFAPGPHLVLINSAITPVNIGYVQVGPDGTGTISSSNGFLFIVWQANVSGITSAPSIPSCPVG